MPLVPHVLIASDAQWVHDEIRSVLSAKDASVQSVTSGRAVRGAVAERLPDLVVLDFQMANMGAMAVSFDLRNEESGGRLAPVKVLMLLDRQADVYLAKQSKAEGWLVKPLDPMRVRRAIDEVLAGRQYVDRVQLGDARANYRPTPDSTAR